MIPEGIKKFAELFAKLPGIGPRQATRLGFYFANRGEAFKRDAIKAIESLDKVKVCARCFYVHELDGEICNICADKLRDQKTIAILEKETDLMSLESTNKYKGVYLIMGDLRKKSVLDPEQKLRLQSLKSRISKLDGGKADEIIIAINPTSVGVINANTIIEELKPVTKKISTLGMGIPFGGEIEFADEETLGAALERRG